MAECEFSEQSGRRVQQVRRVEDNPDESILVVCRLSFGVKRVCWRRRLTDELPAAGTFCLAHARLQGEEQLEDQHILDHEGPVDL